MNRSQLFLVIQIILLGLIAFALIFFQKKNRKESQFKLREADRQKKGPVLFKSDDPLSGASKKKSAPLALEGIRLDVAPHELLGVPANAGEREIRNAYIEKMKRYHPDKVGKPGSREWNDAQTIAEHLNRAKETLLKNLRK